MSVTFIGINAKRDADWITILIKHLRPDFITTPALATVITPGNNKTAILKAGYIGIILIARNISINPELFADSLTVRIKTPSINIRAGAAIIVRAIIIPGNNKSAIFESGN